MKARDRGGFFTLDRISERVTEADKLTTIEPRHDFLKQVWWQQTYTPATAALRRGRWQMGVAGSQSSVRVCFTNLNASDTKTIAAFGY